MLQYDKTPLWIFYLMFASICAITFRSWGSASMELEVLLRVCLIGVVNKNFEIAVSLTTFLRSMWLRSSFVLVLFGFFWFSLLTVNIFHITFVLTVLIFVVKGNSSTPGVPSFRHRNWKYLVLLFDIFLSIRLLWIILKEQSYPIGANIVNFMNILGITYAYNQDFEYFNVVPLLISAMLTVQLWTYSSRIYHLETKSGHKLHRLYRAFLEKTVRVLKICYYKLVPWASHLIVLFILIKLEFSLIAGLLVFWSLVCLWAHMVKPNNLAAYRSLHRLWRIVLKLLAF